MLTLARYLTHPQVLVDPKVAVPSWGLSDVGRARVLAMAAAGWLRGTTQVVASAEKKAFETGTPIAQSLGVRLEIRDAMHENDRSATGFLPSREFEVVADDFFAHPDKSIRGWERAIDAQNRIVREAEAVLGRRQEGHVLFVGHGAVGTLLYCHYANVEINRVHDQPAGGGHYFTMNRSRRQVLHSWRRMEDWP
ncbi:histidine phosphatase family protein [Bradyrhizobium sp. 40]|uniref:histidine phosphatase family protein n=1 Tax=Bradyrhizobium sp. 40 TaxID=2782674 RepID=UPI002000410B|nr:histidine phosphatase family protein [Bradyrhizobium sp. 40]UPJ45855.1 histidine phosphatase family protein [Bradyrhizobium sp. 40]